MPGSGCLPASRWSLRAAPAPQSRQRVAWPCLVAAHCVSSAPRALASPMNCPASLAAVLRPPGLPARSAMDEDLQAARQRLRHQPTEANAPITENHDGTTSEKEGTEKQVSVIIYHAYQMMPQLTSHLYARSFTADRSPPAAHTDRFFLSATARRTRSARCSQLLSPSRLCQAPALAACCFD